MLAILPNESRLSSCVIVIEATNIIHDTAACSAGANQTNVTKQLGSKPINRSSASRALLFLENHMFV